MRKYLLLPLLWLALACSKKGPALPQPAALVFPESNSECTTGVDLGGNSSRVTFEWRAAANSFDYELVVENLFDATDRQIFETELTTQNVVLDKATGYRWQVTSRNEDGTQTAVSPEWYFINAGSLLSFPPFPANMIYPESGARFSLTATGNPLPLRWSVSDIDGDASEVEVFVSGDPDPVSQGVFPASTTKFSLNALPGTRYYWKIRVIDAAGNSSVSRTQDFFAGE